MRDRITFRDAELLYAASARCKCGAGLAYPMDHAVSMKLAAWVCSAVLKGEAEGVACETLPDFLRGVNAPNGAHEYYLWCMWKIREETSIRNPSPMTTRPPGTVCRTIGKATCPRCHTEWESAPYEAAGLGHHWFPGDCPKCSYGVGGHGTYSSNDGPSIDVRYRDVVIADGEALP